MVNVPMKSRKRVMVFGSLIIALTVAMGVAGLTVVHLAHAASFAVTDCTQEGIATTAGTIAKAIADATADAGTSESITFNCGSGNQTIPITTPLVVTMAGKSLSIDGTNGSGTITLDGGGTSQLMQITSAANTTLDNLSFTNATAPSATPQGGAISDTGSDLTLTNDTFSNDVATASATNEADGGALYMAGGNLTVQNSTFDHDSAAASATSPAEGGAIYFEATSAVPVVGTLSVSGSRFTYDSVSGSSGGDGGAIFDGDGTGGSITTSTFDHDSVSSTADGAYGGAVEVASDGTLDAVSGDTFTYDSASGIGVPILGGALANFGTITTVSGCTFDHDSVTNSSTSGFLSSAFGGALASIGTITTLTTSDFTNNTASGGVVAGGGAIDSGIFGNGGIGTISRSGFIGNSVNDDSLGTQTYGGAILAFGGSALTIANSSFATNSATASGSGPAAGGAISQETGSLALLNDTLGGDSVTATGSGTSGGELYVNTGATLTLSNSILANGTVNGAANNCAGTGTLTNGGYNLDSGTSCGFGSTNNSLSSKDPLLGTPASFSGSTLTYPLLPGSPAIDAGNDAVCAAAPVGGIDQRGETRPQGAHCDIGAYEFALFTTTTTLSASPSTQAQGQPVQLCAAVTPASGTPASLGTPSGTITFYDGSTQIGTATLGIGKGCFSTSSLSLGSHNNLTAKYGGDPSFQGSTSAPASVFIGVVGNGGAASGAQPVNPQGPTGGSVTSTGSSNNSSSGTANNTSKNSKTASTTSTQGGLPGWLLVLVVLVVLGGAAGGAVYLRQHGLLARLWAR